MNKATDLHLAAGKGDRRLAEQFIQKGADVNAKDGEGKTPLSQAARRGRKAHHEILDR